MKPLQTIRTISEVDTELLALCERKRAVDDELGRCSDHEGDEHGPTYSMFKNMRPEGYCTTLDYYIGQHERAVRILRRLIRLRRHELSLKEKRRPQTP